MGLKDPAILAVLALYAVSTEAAIFLPTMFQSGMVLQGDPSSAHVYGKTDSEETVRVELFCNSGHGGDYPGTNIDGVFSIKIPYAPEGDICSLVISQGETTTIDEIILDNVLFGDVFVCSGQSNMEFTMNEIFNATEEIANSADFDNIRFYKLDHNTADTPQDELMSDSWGAWSSPAEADRLGAFSAVCFLTARYINEIYGPKPFGLIGSYWGGTRIEAWSLPASLEQCEIEDNIDTTDPQNSNSYLYNAMIHPLTPLSVRGYLWYQGESNTGWNRDKYACTFKYMIESWRQMWVTRTDNINDGDAPFGFVQLADNDPNDQGYSYPIIRWEQTARQGYVPNSDLDDVFMAVALDTHDEENGIHPRDKQTVGYRMALAALNNVYELTEYPWEGPRPISTGVELNDDGTKTVSMTFTDGVFTYTPVENSGFYACALADDIECDNTEGSWTLLDTSAVFQEAPSTDLLQVTVPEGTVAIAYLWRDSPLLVPHGAPIYAEDEWGLPAAPFKFLV